MRHDEKPTPIPSPETATYWEGCAKGELRIQHCTACGNHQFFPRLLCSSCLSPDLEWVVASGRGSVASFTIVRRAIGPFAEDVPYVVALIRLAEGPQMMSNVVGCDPSEVRVGAAVHVDFVARSDSISLPVFRLD